MVRYKMLALRRVRGKDGNQGEEDIPTIPPVKGRREGESNASKLLISQRFNHYREIPCDMNKNIRPPFAGYDPLHSVPHFRSLSFTLVTPSQEPDAKSRHCRNRNNYRVKPPLAPAR